MGEGIIKCHLILPHRDVSHMPLPACPKKSAIHIRYKCVNAYRMIKVTIDLNIMYSTSEEARDHQQFLKASRESFERKKYQLGLKRCTEVNTGENTDGRGEERFF